MSYVKAHDRGVSRQREYRRLMEQVRDAHAAFKRDWVERRVEALKGLVADARAASWEQIWEANGVAYRGAEALAGRRDRLLVELFEGHLIPLNERFLRGEPDAVDAVIDFLEVDVPAFRCGYVKEGYLRDLRKVALTDEHRARLRRYGLGLCGMPGHRREIREAGRLMIRVANREMGEQLRALTTSENGWTREKSAKMLRVVLNGRRDLR